VWRVRLLRLLRLLALLALLALLLLLHACRRAHLRSCLARSHRQLQQRWRRAHCALAGAAAAAAACGCFQVCWGLQHLPLRLLWM
jgi:hypothetical protein